MARLSPFAKYRASALRQACLSQILNELRQHVFVTIGPRLLPLERVAWLPFKELADRPPCLVDSSESHERGREMPARKIGRIALGQRRDRLLVFARVIV